jgi:hypothetical protein
LAVNSLKDGAVVASLNFATTLVHHAIGRYCFDALVLDGYLVSVPKDPWGHEYIYGRNDDVLVISSMGRDGKPGGEGEDEDVFVYSSSRNEGRHGK